jgi:hypothetical protein
MRCCRPESNTVIFWVQKMNRIFYWKESKWMSFEYGQNSRPTLEDFKRDYVQLPVTNIVTTGDWQAQAGELFDRYNRDDNPMSTPDMQGWIVNNLQPHPHTSMSTGDIVEIDGDLYIVKGYGWELLPYKAA